jgi:hypothetical protein
VLPELRGDGGRMRRRQTQPGDVAADAVGELQRALGAGDANVDAVDGAAAGLGMADQAGRLDERVQPQMYQ